MSVDNPVDKLWITWLGYSIYVLIKGVYYRTYIINIGTYTIRPYLDNKTYSL
jgi:hypothetical protein